MGRSTGNRVPYRKGEGPEVRRARRHGRKVRSLLEETFVGEVVESLDDVFDIRPETLGTLVVFVVGIVTLAYWQRMSYASMPGDPVEAARRAPIDIEE
jgi:hypothetical protein